MSTSMSFLLKTHFSREYPRAACLALTNYDGRITFYFTNCRGIPIVLASLALAAWSIVV